MFFIQHVIGIVWRNTLWHIRRLGKSGGQDLNLPCMDAVFPWHFPGWFTETILTSLNPSHTMSNVVANSTGCIYLVCYWSIFPCFTWFASCPGLLIWDNLGGNTTSFVCLFVDHWEWLFSRWFCFVVSCMLIFILLVFNQALFVKDCRYYINQATVSTRSRGIAYQCKASYYIIQYFYTDSSYF